MNDIIFMLIEKNRKNSRLSIADRELFENTLFDELAKGNYDDEIEKVLCEGPAESVMKALALYLTSIEKGDAYDYLLKFVSSDRIQENKGGSSGARMVILFAAFADNSKEQNKLMEYAFVSMVFFAYKKDKGGINKKAIDQIRNSIFPLFENKSSIIDLHFIDKDKVWVKARDLFIEAMSNVEKSSIAIIHKIYYWLESSGRSMGKYSKEYITKITFDQIGKQTKTTISASGKNNDLMAKKNSNEQLEREGKQNVQQVEPAKQKNSNAEVNATTESTKSNNEKHIESNKIFSELIAVTLAGYEKQKSISLEMDSLRKKINDMQLQINKLIGKEEQQREYIQELVSEKRMLTATNVSEEEKIRDLTDLVEKLRAEIDDRKQFTDTVTRNREKQSEEQLNKLASKLKVDYRDFCDAKGIEMTIDLGENMREQLGAVFSILEKNGIKLS